MNWYPVIAKTILVVPNYKFAGSTPPSLLTLKLN
jgi:hypothetical protein